MSEERCSWCDGPVEPDDGFRLSERPGGRRAAFRRHEHVSLLLVCHRGEHRVPDGFCSVQHPREWAQAGGRYA